MDLSNQQIAELNNFASFLSFKETWIYKHFCQVPAKFILLTYGNQGGKTAGTAHSYVKRILGIHPVPKKNVVYWECVDRTNARIDDIAGIEYLKKHKSFDSATWNCQQLPKDMKCVECGAEIIQHKRGSRVFRFCSETLPGQSSNVSAEGVSSEVKNTQYPEFKKWLPPHLIKKDITVRNPALTIHDIFGGQDIIVEFVSYNQSVQSTAGSQRMGIWCVAEGQRVLMSNGVWRNIEQIKEGDTLICEALGGYGSRQKTNKVSRVINNGIKDILRFNCQKGISFEVTPEHLVMVTNRRYIKASNLKVGDSIVCRFSDIGASETLEDWKIILLAVILGDGSTRDGCPKFTSKSKDFVESIKQYLPDGMKFREKSGYGRTPDFYISDNFLRKNRLKEFLQNVGVWGKKADSKFIPDIIFNLDNDKIKLFLKYLYATDGWANGHNVSYCSTSYRLAQDVFLLLRRLGIRSNIVKREFDNGWNTQWWVNISQAYDVINFIENIGIECKQAFTDKVLEEAKRRIKSRFDVCTFKKKGLNAEKKLPQSVKIKSIEHIGRKSVYDISMEKPIRKDGSPLNNFLIQGGVVVHNCDEQPEENFLEEQRPRLIAEDGDLLITCTPADRLTHLYDSVFEKARFYFRTKIIADRYKLKTFERTDSNADIAVFQAATDDNPTLSKLDIEAMFNDVDDPDVLSIRRYGIFKQISGRIYKGFDWNIHVISKERHFPNGVPHIWNHFRGIDYHEHVNWACLMMVISPQDEAFIYNEFNPSPESMVTHEIAKELALISKEYKYTLNLIDPLANKTQTNTGMTIIEDLNRAFDVYRKERIGTGAYWQVWDTKSTRGRDEVRKRLKNAALAGRPFNNTIIHNGRKVLMPTLWILDNCKQTARSFKNWRLEEWAVNAANATKEMKESPQQRWSHFPIVVECLFKHPACRPKAYISPELLRQSALEHRYDRFKGSAINAIA